MFIVIIHFAQKASQGSADLLEIVNISAPLSSGMMFRCCSVIIKKKCKLLLQPTSCIKINRLHVLTDLS